MHSSTSPMPLVLWTVLLLLSLLIDLNTNETDPRISRSSTFSTRFPWTVLILGPMEKLQNSFSKVTIFRGTCFSWKARYLVTWVPKPPNNMNGLRDSIQLSIYLKTQSWNTRLKSSLGFIPVTGALWSCTVIRNPGHCKKLMIPLWGMLDVWGHVFQWIQGWYSCMHAFPFSQHQWWWAFSKSMFPDFPGLSLLPCSI